MEIKDLTKEIRERSIERMKKRPVEKLSASWYQEDLLYSGVGNNIFIIIPTPGCSWALGESGGCTMCSYIADCAIDEIESDTVVELFKKELAKYDNETGTTGIKLFASGSFLNPAEIPITARNEILEILAIRNDIKEIVIESRPEYINETVINDVFNIIGNKLFEISIGLESSDDDIRDNKINKGFSKADFEKAINTIKSMKSQYNIKSKAYILVKPILVDENEAIKTAIDTAKYCEELGVDRVSFCPVTIHKGTLIENLWRKGAYNPPWIWTTIEIITQVRKEVNIPSFMDTSGFGSRRGPYNCKKCNSDLKNLIIESNLSQSVNELSDFDCECKSKWIGEKKSYKLNNSKTPIKTLPLY
ncbi:MAG: archaeosine biosynthesis radical SAM protein RaSEA [Methanobacteriaceae archaeon]